MLFTVLVDYRGGTYMTQLEAADAAAAVYKWAERLRDADLKAWKLDRASAKRLGDTLPIRIEGLQNAWCTSTTSANGDLLLLNIIGTSAEAPQPSPSRP